MKKFRLHWLVFTTILTLLSCKEVPKEKSTSYGKLSLAEWSFHKEIFAGKMTHLEFIQKAADMGFTGVEYVNQFFKDKAEDRFYLDSMKNAAAAAHIMPLLIMVDGEGYLGDVDSLKRDSAVVNHYKWVDAAAYLGCHSIRVNAHGEGTSEVVAQAAVDGLSKLSKYAMAKGINVIVENHGGHSSDGKWLQSVMDQIGMANCGTLPDFGNFCLEREGGVMWGAPCVKEYDKYKGVTELMPYAKGVSAKSHNFLDDGEERDIEYSRMIDIVKSAGYSGYIGVEYEGEGLSEEEGIKATKVLLEKYWK